MDKNYLTSREVAKILNITIHWAVKLVKAGKLEGQKRGRDWMITRESVEKYKAAKHKDD